MNKLVLLILTLLPLSLVSQGWNRQARELLNESRNEEDSWDMELFEEDKQVTGLNESFGPMNYGAFPTPNYDLTEPNSFNGLSSISTCYQPYEINGKLAVFTSFGLHNNPFYADGLKGRESAAFFTVITITDTIDTQGYTTARYQIISRNHPDYVGQGYVKNKTSQIDYLAFTTPEGNDFAVINGRLFHLNHGRFIVIAPQKDGSLRSLQLKESLKTTNEVKDFVERDLLQRAEISRFITNEQTI